MADEGKIKIDITPTGLEITGLEGIIARLGKSEETVQFRYRPVMDGTVRPDHPTGKPKVVGWVRSGYLNHRWKHGDSIRPVASPGHTHPVILQSEHEAAVERLRKVYDPNVLQDDLKEVMEVLGISTHARPVSPHRVFQDEVLPAVRRLMDFRRGTIESVEPVLRSAPSHLEELAMGLIANAYGGDWDRASPEWREAASRWWDLYHEVLDHGPEEPVPAGTVRPDLVVSKESGETDPEDVKIDKLGPRSTGGWHRAHMIFVWRHREILEKVQREHEKELTEIRKERGERLAAVEKKLVQRQARIQVIAQGGDPEGDTDFPAARDVLALRQDRDRCEEGYKRESRRCTTLNGEIKRLDAALAEVSNKLQEVSQETDRLTLENKQLKQGVKEANSLLLNGAHGQARRRLIYLMRAHPAEEE